MPINISHDVHLTATPSAPTPVAPTGTFKGLGKSISFGFMPLPSIKTESMNATNITCQNYETNSTSNITRKSSTFPATSLKQSYVILDEHISVRDGFQILGRVVGNPSSPLEGYSPLQMITGETINHTYLKWWNFEPKEELSQAVSPNPTTGNYCSQGGSSGSDTAGESSSSSVAPDDINLDHYKSHLIFPNLPLRITKSTNTTLIHFSSHTKNSDSLLKALIGLSVSTCSMATEIFQLTSPLIQTVSLMHHDLVWLELKKRYKSELIHAVRKNGGRMFLVVGFKVARDADVEVRTETMRALDGRVAVDIGNGVGVPGLATVAASNKNESAVYGGIWGKVKSMGAGVIAGQETSRNIVRSRGEKIPGDGTFALEYKEVKLKLKLEVGNKPSMETGSRASNRESKGSSTLESTDCEVHERERCRDRSKERDKEALTYPDHDPHPSTAAPNGFPNTNIHVGYPTSHSWWYSYLIEPLVEAELHCHSMFPDPIHSWGVEMIGDDENSNNADDDLACGYESRCSDSDGDGVDSSESSRNLHSDDEYDLELGEEVYLQELV